VEGRLKIMAKIMENQSTTTRRIFIARIVPNEVRIDAGKIARVVIKALSRKY